MTSLFHKRETCRFCSSSRVAVVIPLAPMPIATPNFQVSDAETAKTAATEEVPLEVYLCEDCGLLQILHIGNRELQYSDYIYTTSLSLGLPEHFHVYAKEISQAYELGEGDLVVEFGSNDGTLLSCFKQLGLQVQGIDPAKAISAQATANGTPTLNAFFGIEAAQKILEERGPASILIANNVIANIDDLTDVLAGISCLLKDDGVFIFETQYGKDVVDKNLLDTVYHEHLSYFNISPVQKFFARQNLEVIDALRIGTKGGSIRITVQKAGGPHEVSDTVSRMVEEEEKAGVGTVAYYAMINQRLAAIKAELRQLVAEAQEAGKTVAGYGVSVGTTALMPQFGLVGDIDLLFDDDPNKEKSLTGPGYDIPVFGPDDLARKAPGLVIVFAWRYADPIIAKHEAYLKNGGRFVIPLPDIKMISESAP